MEREALEPEAKVTWLWTPRGGYGWSVPVAGIVEAVQPKTVRIRVARRVGEQWVLEHKNVRAEHLRPRSNVVAALDGPEEPA